MVGAEGFEPPTLCSQSRCATRLRYAPIASFDCNPIPFCPAPQPRRPVSGRVCGSGVILRPAIDAGMAARERIYKASAGFAQHAAMLKSKGERRL